MSSRMNMTFFAALAISNVDDWRNCSKKHLEQN